MQSIPTATATPQPPEAAFAEYRRTRSPQAFEQLMRHYVDLVYASALRQLRDRDQAQDATQVVFTVLAMKAAKLRPDTVLPAWLLKVTRYTVLDARRGQRRRERHELIAQQIRDVQRKSAMNTAVSPVPANSGSDPTGVAIEELRAVLDDGIARLNQSERAAVVLRYFEGKSHGDIAAALGIREDAARKRVQRGLEKLRTFLAGRGAIASTAPPSALASALAASGRMPAPASLVSHMAANAPAIVTGGAAASSASHLVSSAKGVITLMAWT
jgi:RNA polymerase sigma factor (sigma-70 family)